jgi:hypothetical protein
VAGGLEDRDGGGPLLGLELDVLGAPDAARSDVAPGGEDHAAAGPAAVEGPARVRRLAQHCPGR